MGLKKKLEARAQEQADEKKKENRIPWLSILLAGSSVAIY